MKNEIKEVVGKLIGLLLSVYTLTSQLPRVFSNFEGLTDLGLIAYLISFVFILGMFFMLRGDDERAEKCREMLLLCGLFGTAYGITEYLHSWNVDAETIDISGLRYVFLATAEAVLYSIVLMIVSLGMTSKELADKDQP